MVAWMVSESVRAGLGGGVGVSCWETKPESLEMRFCEGGGGKEGEGAMSKVWDLHRKVSEKMYVLYL